MPGSTRPRPRMDPMNPTPPAPPSSFRRSADPVARHQGAGDPGRGPEPLTIAELAEAWECTAPSPTGSCALLRTIRCWCGTTAGRVQPGPGLAALARGVSRDLQSAALPELTRLANT